MSSNNGKLILLGQNVDPGNFISALTSNSINVHDESFWSIVNFLRSGAEVGIVSHTQDELKFLINNRWTRNSCPVTILEVGKNDTQDCIRLKFRSNAVTRWSSIILFTVVTAASAWEIISHGKNTLANVPVKFVVAMLIGCVFTLPLILVSLHSRKEVVYYLKDLSRAIASGNKVERQTRENQ